MATLASQDSTETHPTPEDLALLEAPRRRTWLYGAVAGLLLVGGLGVWWLTGGDGPAYETVSLSGGTLSQQVTAVGQLEPTESYAIGSDLTGRVETVLVDVNDTVQAGELLALLDPTRFQNTVDQQRGSLASARANLAKAKVDEARAQAVVDRTASLVERGVETAVSLETARFDLDAAKASRRAASASVAQATAALERAEQDLSDTEIRSPVDGVIIQRLVDPGQTVVSSMSATSLFEVASDLAQLKVEVQVDEADVGRVASGQSATFTVSAYPERRFEAAVVDVDVAADPDSSVVVYNAEIGVENGDLSLRPGMTATAEILVGEVEGALLVPSLALRYRPSTLRRAPDGEHVWVLDGDEPTAVPVEVGGSDGSRTAVYGEGLVAGMDVIVGGAQ